MSASILYVEHDSVQRDALARSLGAFDFKVNTAGSCAEAWLALAQGPYDLVVMNQDLPDGDGIELTRQFRFELHLPIIMLSASNAELDRVLALELGADDFVSLPASPRELVARVRAVLRRVDRTRAAGTAPVDRRSGSARTYRFDGWELNTGRRALTNPQGQRIALTNTEFTVLVTFLARPRQVLTRDLLLEASRMHCDVYDRTIDVQILRLRRKIEVDPKRPQILRTERGVGYLLDVEVQVTG